MKGYYKYIVGVSIAAVAISLLAWRRKAVKTASDFINMQEIGDNNGWANKAFEKMMRDIGWSSGEAWCMYLAKLIYMNAFPAKADKINKVLTGSTQGSFKAAQESDLFKVITEGRPKPGDIVIWQSTKNSSLGHAGVVKKSIGDDQYEVVEGNTSLDGAREGQGSRVAKRKLVPGYVDGTLRVKGFIRMKLI